MHTYSAHMRSWLAMGGALVPAIHLIGAVIQVGTGGGMTSPGGWSSGDPDAVDSFTALELPPPPRGTIISLQ